MKLVAETNCYSLRIDENKHRVYITMSDVLHSPMDNFKYLFDLKTASQEMPKDFTVLADWTQVYKPLYRREPIDWEIRNIFREAGVRKTAEIVALDVVTDSPMPYWEEVGIAGRAFADKVQAEKWLDEG